MTDAIVATRTSSGTCAGTEPGGSENPFAPVKRWDFLESGLAEELLARQRALPPGGLRERIRTELVELHIGYMRSLARQYAGRGEPLDDLEQAAMLGLVEAINRFDPAAGPRFLPFARLTMLGELKRHFRDRTWRVRVPRRIQELRPLVRRTAREFAAVHHRTPGIEELAEILGVSGKEVAEVLEADSAYSPTSLDLPLSDNHDSAVLGDLVADPTDELGTIEDTSVLLPLLTTLPAREQRIVLLRFWGNRSQDQIAEDLGISQMHVSRLLRRTLDQLRIAMLAD